MIVAVVNILTKSNNKVKHMKKIISISLVAAAGLAMSSIALSAGGIPGSFPANSNGLSKMPSQATSRQPAFPPGRAMGQPSAPPVQSIPSMPNQSIQGTSRIPGGPGRDGFNNRGRR